MREEDMDMGQPSMEIDVEIDQAEGDDEANFQEMAPKGRFTAKALNNLVKATNRLLPLFDQTPDYPSFEEDITEFPTEFVRVLAMFQGAAEERRRAGDQRPDECRSHASSGDNPGSRREC